MTLSMLTIEGTWRDISAAPLARAVAMTAEVQTPADHVIPDEALNRILGLSRTCQTDPDGLARVQVVKAPGVVYRVVFGGVVGHLRCDDWDDDTTVPFVGIKDVPGGDVEVDPLTWDAVISGLNGRIAAQVPPAVASAVPAYLAAHPDLIEDAAAAAGTAVVAATSPRINAEAYRTAGKTDLQVILDAMSAATSLTKGAVVQLGPRTYDVGSGLSLAGMTCGLVGASSSGTATASAGTVLWASSQAGAVLDMTDWTGPSNERGRVEFGGFALRGSGVGPTTNHGWYQPKVKSGMHIRDVHIENTTGTGMHLNELYLSDVSRITVLSPINAAANDVPHFRLRECNGTRFRGLGMRSLLANGAPGGDCAPSGALQIEDGDYLGSPHSGHDILIEAPWVEYLHVPTGGTVISVKSNSTTISDLQVFDVSKEPGAVDTSCIRIDAASFQPLHGNVVRGVIPGRQAACPDYGVDIVAGSHLVQGAKGYNGYNVRLRSGVSYTTVILGGRVAAASAPAVQDDSGQTTNAILDYANNRQVLGASTWEHMPTASNRGFRITDKDATGSGALWLGDQGARIQAATSGNVLLRAGTGGTSFDFYPQSGGSFVTLALSGGPAVRATPEAGHAAFRAASGWYEHGTAGPRWMAGAGSPEGAITAPVGSLYSRSDGGAGTSLYVKESGTGSTGWVAK